MEFCLLNKTKQSLKAVPFTFTIFFVCFSILKCCVIVIDVMRTITQGPLPFVDIVPLFIHCFGSLDVAVMISDTDINSNDIC